MAFPRNAAVIIDNSGSTSMKSGITHKESGHEMTVLDRHVMTAAVYLTNFPKKGSYRIISSHRLNPAGYYDFDNTDDAIEYLFTLRPGGVGFNRNGDELAKVTKDYNNVLLIVDEQLRNVL